MSLRGWRWRLERALKRHGPSGIPVVLARLWIARIRERVAGSGSPAREVFDAQHGVDTGGRISLSDLSIRGESAVWGTRYQGVSRSVYEAAMGACGVDHARFAFVDLGSGKGRALLLASHYPFRRIIGVELVPELHAVAERNVAAYRDDAQRCRRFELLCADVASFSFPEEPCLVYMYHPFEGPVMQRTAAAIGRLAEDPKREFVIAYVNPLLAGMLDALPALRRVATATDYVVWHSRGVGVSRSP